MPRLINKPEEGDKLYNVSHMGQAYQVWAPCPFDARERTAKYAGVLPRYTHRLVVQEASGAPDTTMEL